MNKPMEDDILYDEETIEIGDRNEEDLELDELLLLEELRAKSDTDKKKSGLTQLKMIIIMDEILYRASVISLCINAVIDTVVFIFVEILGIRIITITMCILSLVISQLLIFVHDKKFGGD